MNIGIDVDDVLADFISAHRDVCRLLFNKPVHDEEPCDWEWTNYDLTEDQHSLVWKVIHGTENFWENLKPIVRVPLYYASQIHNLYFITNRKNTPGKSAVAQTQAFLNREFRLPFPSVLIASKKGLVAEALDLHCFIDDKKENCIDVKRAVPKCRVFVKDSGHNQGFKMAGVERVKDFTEFTQRIGLELYAND